MDATTKNFNKVQGELLKQADVKVWTPAVFHEYFTFCDMFYHGGKILVTLEAVLAAEQYQDASRFIYEMLARIDRPTSMEEWDARSFYMRLNTLMRVVKQTIQKFPELLTPLTVDKQRIKPQYSWLDDIYADSGKVKQPEAVVEAPKVQTGLVAMSPLAPAQRLADAMGKVADLYYAIAESITDDDIQSLSPEKKINALNKLSYVHANMKQKGLKVNFNFNKVTKGSSVEDMEAALLETDDNESEE